MARAGISRSTRWARSCSSERGFSLIEVLVATGMLAVVSLGVAQMFALATAKNLAAKGQVSTTMLATQKMEQLRGLIFAYDASGLGLPVTDSSSNLSKCTPDTSGHGLNPAPTDVLERDTAGFVDYLDGQGNCLDMSSTANPAPPAGTVYTRRWAIWPLPTNPNNTLILEVVVTPTAKETIRAQAHDPTGRTRLVEDSMLVSVLTRKAP
ncbi:MAG: hypothetical protein DMF86_06135 [Acidobacteria bacterium]|nr:MAG: hypothetical protein DMF86_06135 [Acidobacteriota bacterium]